MRVRVEFRRSDLVRATRDVRASLIYTTTTAVNAALAAIRAQAVIDFETAYREAEAVLCDHLEARFGTRGVGREKPLGVPIPTHTIKV